MLWGNAYDAKLVAKEKRRAPKGAKGKYAGGRFVPGAGAQRERISRSKAKAMFTTRPSAFQAMLEGSGFSYQPVRGLSPITGYMVSPYEADGLVVKKEDLTGAKMLAFFKRKRHLLARKDHYMGGWLNDEDGNYYLDISIRVNTKAEANALGAKNNQKAYWGVKEKEEYKVTKALGTKSSKPILIVTRPANESPDGFKDWVTRTYQALTGNEIEDIPESEWQSACEEFWGGADEDEGMEEGEE